MKLSLLNPRWIVGGHWEEPGGVLVYNQDNFWKREAMGVSFDCPHCHAQRLAVYFLNPVDEKPPESGVPLWLRSGDTFENLTLSPSIDTTQRKIDFQSHWHGFITKGEVT